MRDVVKTNVKRDRDGKRTRRRKKNIPLYVFLIIILVLTIGVLLSVTLLFNVDKINVNGDVDYSKESVIKASGIEIGDNMVRLDAKEAEQRILSSMVYIEEADIKKQYPDTLQINLKKCVPSASVEYANGYLLISAKGKILDSVTQSQSDIPVIKGLEPKNFRLGEYLISTDEQKTDIYMQILEAVSEIKSHKVTTVDISDKYAMKLNFDGKIDFELGNANDIAYKLNLANTVLRDIGKDKKGTMVMVGANQISFRTNDGNNMIKNNKIPVVTTKPEEASETSEEQTSEEPQYDYIDEDGDGIPDDDYYDDGNYEEEVYGDENGYEGEEYIE